MRGLALTRISLALQLMLVVNVFCLVAGARSVHARKTYRNDQKIALVVAPIGDTSLHRRWLNNRSDADDATERNWDLVALYYGSTPDTFKCPECVGVQVFQGAKWRVVSHFLNSSMWRLDLSHRYEMVMVADDDLELPLTMLNRFFQIFKAFKLLLAQPAVCP